MPPRRNQNGRRHPGGRPSTSRDKRRSQPGQLPGWTSPPNPPGGHPVRQVTGQTDDRQGVQPVRQRTGQTNRQGGQPGWRRTRRTNQQGGQPGWQRWGDQPWPRSHNRGRAAETQSTGEPRVTRRADETPPHEEKRSRRRLENQPGASHLATPWPPGRPRTAKRPSTSCPGCAGGTSPVQTLPSCPPRSRSPSGGIRCPVFCYPTTTQTPAGCARSRWSTRTRTRPAADTLTS
ncbi:unnamed protein product [Ixodes persulcatus]